MRKKAFVLVTALALALGLLAAPALALPGLEGGYTAYAEGWLQKALDYGLVTDAMKSADLTKPITREEFCEIAVLLYTSVTGTAPEPVSPNPFTDTDNVSVLRARALNITSGDTPTTFAPDLLIPREQCAMMLLRAVQAIDPGGDYAVDDAPDFIDQAKIADYARDAAKYMNKRGFIAGDLNRNFMPKDNAKREDAFIMICKIYEAFADRNTMVAAAEAFFADGVFHIELRLEFEGEEMWMEMYVKDGKTSVTVEIDGETMRVIILADKAYVIFDGLRMYTEADADDIPPLPTDNMLLNADAVLTGTGTAPFKGRDLFYEEYYLDDGGDEGTARYFFDGGELVGIRITDGDETADIDILALDKDVPDSVFTIPRGYIKI